MERGGVDREVEECNKDANNYNMEEEEKKMITISKIINKNTA